MKKEESNSKAIESIGRAGKEKIEQMYSETREQLNQRI
jgi:hypothetical protein